MTSAQSLKQSLAERKLLLGTWLKTPSAIVAEVLAGTALDLLCLDSEHAPFDRPAIDACVFAARACGMPILVRPQTAAPHHILSALDVGASGVVAPHIRSAAEAASLVRAAHYGPRGRGYAGSTRAANYTRRSLSDNIAAARDATVTIAQIEDGEALADIDGIAATPGLDALFIGRADLAVSLEAGSAAAPEVIAAAEQIAAAGKAAGCAVGTFLGTLDEIPFWVNRGITLFLLKSDHHFLLAGAVALRSRFDALTRPNGPSASTDTTF